MENKNQTGMTNGIGSLHNKVIAASKEPPINSNKDNTALLEIIKYVGQLLGVRAPTLGERETLIDYIREHLGALSIAEFRVAFDMAMNDQYYPHKINTYGAISVQMIQQVINHYKRYRFDVLSNITQSSEQKEIDIDQVYKDSIERLKEAYDKGGIMALDAEANWDGKYNWMARNGYFKGMPYNKEEIKKQARQAWVRSIDNAKAAAKNMADARRAGDLIKQIKRGDKIEGEDVAIAYQGKRLMVIEWIKWNLAE